MFRLCNLCSALCGGSEELQPLKASRENSRLMLAHANSHRIQMRLNSVCKNISSEDVFTKCFAGKDAITKEKTERRLPINDAPIRSGVDPGCVSNVCRSLFVGRDRKAPVACAKCGLKLKVFYQGKMHSEVAVDHACAHLRKVLFTCRRCDYGAFSLKRVTKHIRNGHKSKPCKDDYKDLSSNYQKDIATAIKQCFGQKSGSTVDKTERVMSKERYRAVKTENQVRSRASTNSLRADRSLHCRSLLKQFRKKSGKIRCRLCSKDVCVTRRGDCSYLDCGHAFRHAFSHLGKPIFSCRFCTKTASLKDNIRSHIKNTHKGRSSSHFEDRSDDFHSEILDILSDCYNHNN